jgi:hypothetical protein
LQPVQGGLLSMQQSMSDVASGFRTCTRRYQHVEESGCIDGL